MNMDFLHQLPPLPPYLETFVHFVDQAEAWGLDTKTLLLVLAFLLLWLRCRIGRRRLIKAHQSQLHELQDVDGLTQVVNRRAAERRLQHLIENFRRYGHGFSVILLELDQLKQINRVRGHRMGDALLADASQRIQMRLRRMDVLGRWSGARFVILCPGTDSEQALILAEKLRVHVSDQPLEHAGAQTASFGVVEGVDKEMTAESLMSMAEDALFMAKNEGGNSVRGWA